MIVIRKIDHLRDGGTITIDSYLSKNEMEEFDLEWTNPLITIDYSIGSDTHGEWFNFFKKDGGKVITNTKLKNMVIVELETMIEREQFLINKLKNGLNFGGVENN
jgi:hypothetical protein